MRSKCAKTVDFEKTGVEICLFVRLSVAHSGKVTSTHLAPPTGLLPRKVERSCTALAKSSKGAALPCPQEKQRGSCTALTEKQRVAALRPKNSNGDTSHRVLESFDPKRIRMLIVDDFA